MLCFLCFVYAISVILLYGIFVYIEYIVYCTLVSLHCRISHYIILFATPTPFLSYNTVYNVHTSRTIV